jgi:PilZ domain
MESEGLTAGANGLMPDARTSGGQRRQFARYEVQCRARICIGKPHYGYLHNVSQGGAKLRTISPIREVGEVMLTLPDLPPMRCQLRWSDSYNAGVSFDPSLTIAELAQWAETRSLFLVSSAAEIAEVEELAA